MSNGNNAVGAQGESIALGFLKKQGLKWIASNVRSKWGEIDLIMRDKEYLVFVEVKTRKDNEFGEPEEAVTDHKQNHMIKAAIHYLQKTSGEDTPIRFHVVSVGKDGIKHFVDAFETSGDFYC
jgi:putative endonuclease